MSNAEILMNSAKARAVITSALLKLKNYVDKEASKKYFTAAKTIIATLTSKEYIAEAGTNGGFLLKHRVGHNPRSLKST